jgi:hypothetical protein
MLIVAFRNHANAPNKGNTTETGNFKIFSGVFEKKLGKHTKKSLVPYGKTDRNTSEEQAGFNFGDKRTPDG